MNEFENIFSYLKKDSDGVSLIERLEKHREKEKQYSDLYVVDESGKELQYVQLVQEGGGTLGISLVGFCFVLEYMGIRFLKLAGTSAGAINTLFMAALGKNKNRAVTPQLFNIVSKMDMFSFVDGHWIAKGMISSVISKDGWFKSTIIAYVIIILLLLFYFPVVINYSFIARILYWIFLGAFLLFTAIIVFLFYRFKKARYGINPGNEFTKFLKQNIGDNNSKAKLDCIAGFSIDPQSGKAEVNGETYQFKLRNQNLNGSRQPFKDLRADYTFVTTDIASERKVELPKQAGLFWEKPNEVNPAEFVRASMAIPLFFEPLIVTVPKEKEVIINSWKEIFVDIALIPDKAIFIDGGSISNFPISIFHNDKIEVPRLPVLGIRINDVKHNPRQEIRTFLDYAGKIVNTMKTYYDREFLTKNNFYEKYSIADINTYETNANWLDFNMNEKNKRALFTQGVRAAIAFLENFNWDIYKKERARVYSDLKNK
ncbi:patatin-like phospholipase family protein [Niabella aquatica]